MNAEGIRDKRKSRTSPGEERPPEDQGKKVFHHEKKDTVKADVASVSSIRGKNGIVLGRQFRQKKKKETTDGGAGA